MSTSRPRPTTSWSPPSCGTRATGDPPGCRRRALVAWHDARHLDLLARARVRVDHVDARGAAEPAELGLADEDRRALRAVALLDPDLLTLVEAVHGRHGRAWVGGRDRVAPCCCSAGGRSRSCSTSTR